MQLSNEYMKSLKKRAGTELIELLTLSYKNHSLNDALDKADAGMSDIKSELNRYAIMSLITAISEASGSKVELDEFLRETESIRLDAMITIAKWGKEAVAEKMRELASEDFDDAIRSNYDE